MKACTAEQMRAIDRAAMDQYGIPSLLLMENAGRAVAERVLARLAVLGRPDPTVLVFCGKGNNGGDGFVAARHLASRGVRVRCTVAGNPGAIQGDARVNLKLLRRLGIPVLTFMEGPAADLSGIDLLVDALLGTGFTGEPRGDVADAIQAINASGLPVVAVDLPSGLNANTGRPGGVCVQADETVTFGLPKLGLLTSKGKVLAGEVTVANISLPYQLLTAPNLQAEWLMAERVRPLWPQRFRTAHKGDSGRVFVLAGSVGLTGAAAMACEAALRAGAGLVTLGIPASLNPVLEAKLTEVMTVPLPETPGQAHSIESLDRVREFLRTARAVALGPGFGRQPESAELLRAVLAECAAPMVVDADGLTLLSPADEHTFPPHCVLTPHPGEMARLLGTDVETVQSNRRETVLEAARRLGCVIVLKGPATLVATPEGRLAVNSSGSAALATGGTGDVLTGMIAASLARGLDPYEAAVAGVYLHGVAGEVAGQQYGAPGTIAGDVTAAIPEALRRLWAGELPRPCRIL